MITLRPISESTIILWGKPLHPITQEKKQIIFDIISPLPGLLEAHLPYALFQGDKSSDHLLVLVFESEESIQLHHSEIVNLLADESPLIPSITAVAIARNELPARVKETQTLFFSTKNTVSTTNELLTGNVGEGKA